MTAALRSGTAADMVPPSDRRSEARRRNPDIAIVGFFIFNSLAGEADGPTLWYNPACLPIKGRTS
jgi:hypothetical protein